MRETFPPSHEPSAITLQFDCGSVPDLKTIRITLVGRLATPDDQPVTLAEGAPQALELRLVEAFDSGGCKQWHLP